MATKFLINTVRVGTEVRYAGESYDTTNDAAQISRIEASGGVLLESTAQLVAAASVATRLREAGAALEAGPAMLAGAVASVAAVSGAAVPATRSVASGGGLTGGGTLAADRTLAVGAGSGITVNADDVAVTFGLVGEMATSIGSANDAGAVAKSASIAHAHAHGAQPLGDGTDHAEATSIRAGFISPARVAKLDLIQAGTGTLSAGEATVSGVSVSASTRIVATVKAAGADAITGMATLDTGSARTNGASGTGSFVVRALDDAKAVIATAVCTFDWIAVDAA